ncbi:hypothetical protein DEA8626_00548 [Defluviimonas aquaemixtae]|uniref:Uncharacterized protein n=1 Tax=Albidovulum aquaemixtae TaxID=1542388 RepID=A0A2R8B327_9RHOB|nr:hypothetical protein DEA8626_00548 [Defluviimonas aquaemixtae]
MASNDDNSDIHLAPVDNLALLRGRAISAYARVDWHLFMLLQALTDVPHLVAAEIYYNIVNTRSRVAIFTNILSTTFIELKPFWSGVLSEYGKLTTTRNSIIHWVSRGSDDRLMPPNFLSHKETTPSIGPDDLISFCAKADQISEATWMFTRIMLPDEGDDIISEICETWLGIFQLPFVYPFPDSHPLHPSHRGRSNPLRSSAR